MRGADRGDEEACGAVRSSCLQCRKINFPPDRLGGEAHENSSRSLLVDSNIFSPISCSRVYGVASCAGGRLVSGREDLLYKRGLPYFGRLRFSRVRGRERWKRGAMICGPRARSPFLSCGLVISNFQLSLTGTVRALTALRVPARLKTAKGIFS